MNLDYCSRCGKLYVKNPLGVCAACVGELEEMYRKCVEYLRKHRGATIQELSENTGVPQKQIIKFIKDGRISIGGHANISYPCEVCGQPIREGSMCEKCRGRLSKNIGQLAKEKEEKESAQQRRTSTYKIRENQE